MTRFAFLSALLSLAFALGASAETSNGNDFALAVVEAKTPAAQKAVLDDAHGRPHYFRYLKIMEMQPITAGSDGVLITAFEPSSYLDIKFTVTMPVSLALLKSDPASKVGDAIAVTGKVMGFEPGKNNVILLDNTIVRHKDRFTPKAGEELLGEVSPGATFYSYTEGPRPVNVEFRDRDLLVNRDKVLAAGGPKAWAAFLEKEIAKRKLERAAAAKEGSK
jgi:hypothetical protein